MYFMAKSNILAENFFLSQYDTMDIDKSSVSIDTLIFSITDRQTDNYRKLSEKELSILLIKRNEHPHKNKWALPGTFLDLDESLEESAVLKIKENVVSENIYIEQLFTLGDVRRDRRMRVLSCSYLALIDNTELNINEDNEILEMEWFSLKISTYEEFKTEFYNGYHLEKRILVELIGKNEVLQSRIGVTLKRRNNLVEIERRVLESDGIAFDHGKIIYYGLETLRAKTECSDIVFHLMSEEFTFTELQNVYEAILDKKLLTANFRRKVSKYLEETDNISQHAGHRPARMYKNKKLESYDFY